MRRKTAVIIIVALLCTMTIISGYEFLGVNIGEFMLDVTYEKRDSVWRSHTLDHFYDTVTIRTSISIPNYATLGNYRVFGYPFWLNVSDWSEGQSVVIMGNPYVISQVSQKWMASQGNTELYYDREAGFLVRIYTDEVDFSGGWPTGYSTSVALGANNLGELESYISGRYLIYDNLLIIGIFAELAIISWLATKKKNSKESGTESADSYTTVNSLSVFK